ncbi:ankyrin repeat-containing protein At3g12360-like [Solanum tuberosum]|uniref:ankyrin repeat-containing protein At3g12360-like n=1 Tax=Solanum tuberosum TaxID=4113 RepID=UPI00073A45E1|nr:PREDICTED: ankyrin repeat-containing protein At3g12360-like [Solanum tuberosum]
MRMIPSLTNHLIPIFVENARGLNTLASSQPHSPTNHPSTIAPVIPGPAAANIAEDQLIDIRLREAAKKGDVHHLQSLIKEVPFLLSTVSLAGSNETPLHIACLSVHLEFAKEIIHLRPEFARELNQDGFSPLHIASANGDIEIVKELLNIDHNLCFLKGKHRRIPLHYVVIKGRKHVIKELLVASPDSAAEVTARGETCLHLAVKNHQFENFKLLLENLKEFNKYGLIVQICYIELVSCYIELVSYSVFPNVS